MWEEGKNLLNKEILAPVVLFAYNRPEHVQRTLTALNQNRLADKTNLYIFIDGPKSLEDLEKVRKVRSEVKDFRTLNRFKEIHVFESEYNKGLAKSIISGVNLIIKEYGNVIVLEDDILTAPDFLLFMNNALEYYRNDKRVWSISGYTFADKRIKKKCKHDIFPFYRGSSWGWSTWQDRWELTDWQLLDYTEFKTTPKKIATFARGGNDLPDLLDAQAQGAIDSWSIIFDYEESKRNCVTIYPRDPKAVNIGMDGTGTHCHQINGSLSNVNLKEKSFELVPIAINEHFMRLCTNYFSPKETIPEKIWMLLKTIYRKLQKGRTTS